MAPISDLDFVTCLAGCASRLKLVLVSLGSLAKQKVRQKEKANLPQGTAAQLAHVIHILRPEGNPSLLEAMTQYEKANFDNLFRSLTAAAKGTEIVKFATEILQHDKERAGIRATLSKITDEVGNFA